MGCQKEIARKILDRDAGYVLAVKGNQGQLYQDMGDLFQAGFGTGLDDLPHDYAATLNKDRGRIERRECWTISDPACPEYLSTVGDWPGLRSVGMVRPERREGEEVSVETRYCISSLESDARRFLRGGEESLGH
ncbi:MAG: ISAs1 family transposase [Chloroflexi bacterium]|nr:ISAs1 family transposase [Chloroflexota bacterium]MYE40521.1 ISAs1 family transposase [Chloroflexota bacterium]